MPAPAPAPISRVDVITPLPVQRKEGEQVVVPLTGVVTTVTIKDFIAEVAIKQRFENTEAVPIEAVYEFPVDPKFAVCAFRAEVDGKVIEGKIKEKQKAREAYDDAIAQGHGAYLLEEKDNQPTVFSASVGNLPPGKAVLLTITYVTELDFEDGKLKYVLPTQPYAPNGRDPTPKFTAAKSQEYVKDVPYGLSVSVKFDMTSNIKSISSPSHPINFEFGDSPRNATVQLLINESGAPLLKDFVVTTTLFDPHAPCVRIEDIGGGKKAALVALYPKMDEEGDVFTEMIFVVDQSGSMAGSRMTSVKETLQIFLRSIPEGTLFNIVGFGTSTKSLFKESKEYNDANLATAVKFVEQMFANLGGTNIIKPLMEIFSTPAKPGIPRQLFLLTDGEVNNTQECIDTVRRHAVSTRVFTFGIGNDASKQLVTGMAEAGEGKSEFVRPGDNMEEKVLRQLQRALKPAFTDLSVDWGDQKSVVQQAPYRLPPVFSGQRVIVYGVFGGNIADGQVTLKAATPKGPFTTTVPLVSANAAPGKLIYRLASRALIRDLTEKRSYMHDNAMKLTGKYKEDDVKKEVISLSIASGVASSYTSFIAVEERSEATIGEMQLRKVAVADAPAAPAANNLMSNLVSAPVRASSFQSSAPPPPPPAMGGGGYGGYPPPPMQGGYPPSVSYGAPPPPAGAPPPPAAYGPPGAYPTPSSSFALAGSMPPSGPGRGGALMAKAGPPPSMERNRSSSPRASAALSAAPAPMRRLSGGAPPREKEEEKKDKLSSPVKAKKSSQANEYNFMPLASSSAADSLIDLSAQDEEADMPMREQQSMAFAAPSAPAAFAGPSSPIAPPKPSSAPAPSHSGPDVSVLIKQATASGSFPLAAVAAVFPHATLDKVRAALPAGTSGAQAEAILITAIVLAIFGARYADKKINWDLVAQKARKWVKKEAAAIKADAADWDAAAQKFLASMP